MRLVREPAAFRPVCIILETPEELGDFHWLVARRDSVIDRVALSPQLQASLTRTLNNLYELFQLHTRGEGR